MHKVNVYFVIINYKGILFQITVVLLQLIIYNKLINKGRQNVICLGNRQSGAAPATVNAFYAHMPLKGKASMIIRMSQDTK